MDKTKRVQHCRPPANKNSPISNGNDTPTPSSSSPSIAVTSKSKIPAEPSDKGQVHDSTAMCHENREVSNSKTKSRVNSGGRGIICESNPTNVAKATTNSHQRDNGGGRGIICESNPADVAKANTNSHQQVYKAQVIPAKMREISIKDVWEKAGRQNDCCPAEQGQNNAPNATWSPMPRRSPRGAESEHFNNEVQNANVCSMHETASTIHTHALNIEDLVRQRRRSSALSVVSTTSRKANAPLHVHGDVAVSEVEIDNYYVISDTGSPLFARTGEVDSVKFIIAAAIITSTLENMPKDEELWKIVTNDGIIIFKRAPHAEDGRLFICDSRDASNYERLTLALDYLRYQVTSQFPYTLPLPTELGVYNATLEIESVINLAENDLGACFGAVNLLPMSPRLRANVAKQIGTVLTAKPSGVIMCVVFVVAATDVAVANVAHPVCVVTTAKTEFANLAHPVNIHMLQNWVDCNTREYRGKEEAQIVLPKLSETRRFTVYEGTVGCEIELVFVSDKIFKSSVESIETFIEFRNRAFEEFVKTGYDEDIQRAYNNNNKVSIELVFERIIRSEKKLKLPPALSALLKTRDELKKYSDLLIQCVFMAGCQYFATYIQRPAGADLLLTEEKVKAINREYYTLHQQMKSLRISEFHEVIVDLGTFEARRYSDVEIFAVFKVDANIEKIEAILEILTQWIRSEKQTYIPGVNYQM